MDRAGTARAFLEDGFVRIDTAFAPGDAAAMCDVLWTTFERQFGIVRADPSTWTRPFRKTPLHKAASSHLFSAVFTPRLSEAVDVLLGEGAWQWPPPGELLVTFPNTSSWELPHLGWHQDWSFQESTDPLRFFKAFFFLSEVGVGGGGTLVVLGSHRLEGKYGQGRLVDDHGRVKKGSDRLFHECSWLRDLCSPGDPVDRFSRFVGQSSTEDGTPLEVVELTGHPGDVVIVHPWLIHAIAPNAAPTPRFMRAALFHKERAAKD